MRDVSLGACLLVVVAVIGSLSWWAMPERGRGVCGLSAGAEEASVLAVEGAGELLEELAPAIADLEFAYAARMAQEGAGLQSGLVVFLELEELGAATMVPGSFEVSGSVASLRVAAGDVEGLRNGLYGLCRDWLGARWYWAGELGFELVADWPVVLPELPWRESPAFVQRTLYPADGAFAGRNRLNRRYSFNHNLASIFSQERFEESTDGFALINGRRWKPSGSRGLDANPDFTSGRAVELSAEAALAHFEANPESTSFSLSINDNVHFDESKWTEMALSPLRYFRGRPNYTDLVFRYMNLVARKVFDGGGAWQTPSGRPRYLTALAYYWTEPSPSFALHPRVMPVLTSDRAQWHDAAYRAEDRALVERWCASGAERVATWDYYFGAPYPYPRQFNQWIDASLKHLHASGVDVFFSQLPSAWGLDGAKAWLAAELLWDPRQDSEVLLTEYYTTFFGAAADAMRRFYGRAEAHRNAHEGAADWIKLYKDEAGVRLLSEELIESMRADLSVAATAVQGDARRLARVEVASDAFRLTELYFVLQQAREQLALQRWHVETERGAEDLAADFVAARTAYVAHAERLVEDPMHARLKSFTEMGFSDPTSLLAPSEWVADWDGVLDASLVHAPDAWEPLNFLGPALPKVAGWSYWIRAAEGFEVTGIADAPGHPEGLAAGVSVVAGRGFRLENTDMCWLEKRVPVEAGQCYRVLARFAARVSLDNRSQLMLTWLDAEGRRLLHQYPLQIPHGDWSKPRRLGLEQVAPEGAVELLVRFSVSRQGAGDFFELSEFVVSDG